MSDFATRIQRERLGLDKPLPEDQPPPRQRLTMDQLLDLASEIAQDEKAGPDRFRAMRMLATVQSASVKIPEPKADGEVIAMLGMMMKGCGSRIAQVAYQRSFPSARDATFAGGGMAYKDATPEMQKIAKRMTSLPLLNKHFPEHKINGIPKGYPSGRSQAIKTEWCQQEALRRLVEAELKNRKQGHDAMTAVDDEIRGAMDGSAPQT